MSGGYGDAAAEAVDVVAARSLLSSQDTIRRTTKSGILLDDLSQSIAGGWRGDPLRVIEFGDALVSLDNRRLAAARLIDAEVPIRRVSLADPEVQQLWERRDGPRTSVRIRGTNMSIDVSGRVYER
ncbi:MAG: hypothetical protein RMJ55_17040 [Roseiflexaceae bacterium]|nr:hypothetical protein [Roseiflexaceae bacterium]